MTTVSTSGGPRPVATIVAVLLAIAVTGSAAAESAGPAGRGALLDGAVFDGPTGAEGRPANHIDHVVFADGRFLSQGCARWGFGEADYEAWRDGDVIHFEAVTVSPTHGRLAWQGSVDGDRIEATFVWTKNRIIWTTRRAYWFRGTRAAASGDTVADR